MLNSVLFDGSFSSAVVCHDAGAANIVIAGLLRSGVHGWRAYMQGPAERLWRVAYPESPLYEGLDEALEGTALLITGTGWASDVEHDARKLARSRGLKSVAVIDHWVNYAERFIRHGEKVWPDEFWVTDEYALDIAKRTFPTQIVCRIPNYYIESQLRDIAQIERASSPELLYVLEPARSNWGRGISGEFQALDYFVSRLPELGLPANIMIRLRPHPSDVPDKYKHWVACHPDLNIQMDETLNITQSLGQCAWVAGCESFALILALLAGRKVYCALPPWAPACRLPHTEIAHIKKMGQKL